MNKTVLLAPTEERPLPQKPDLPLWSENYLFQAYDPAIDVGFWTHIGLPVYDFGLWHDITIVYLPGGVELLVAKGHGSRDGAADVSGSMATADYDEASGEWVVRFRGACQRVDRHAVASAPASDRQAEPFACELRYSGLCPVWDMTEHVAGQSWSNAHWEQPCTVTGWVEWDGDRHPFQGAGVRDHSRGSRDFAHMGPYYFLQGEFPSGRAFGVLHVEATPSRPRALSTAFLVDGGERVDATVVSLPADRSFTDPFEVVLAGPAGQETITGRLIHEMTLTMRYPNEVVFGNLPGEPHHFIREGQIGWTWDDEAGYGVGERGVPTRPDGSPDTA